MNKTIFAALLLIGIAGKAQTSDSLFSGSIGSISMGYGGDFFKSGTSVMVEMPAGKSQKWGMDSGKITITGDTMAIIRLLLKKYDSLSLAADRNRWRLIESEDYFRRAVIAIMATFQIMDGKPQGPKIAKAKEKIDAYYNFVEADFRKKPRK